MENRISDSLAILLPLFQSAIQRIIPHRYPFLLVDRVIEFVPAGRIVGIKRFSANESAIVGFLPQAAQAPGGLLIEAVTQLGAILVLERPEMTGKVAVILQVPSAQLLKAARPGDTVRLEAEILKLRPSLGELRGRIWIGEELIGEGQMRFAVTEAAGLLSQG